jgi:hypothetical protein
MNDLASGALGYILNELALLLGGLAVLDNDILEFHVGTVFAWLGQFAKV